MCPATDLQTALFPNINNRSKRYRSETMAKNTTLQEFEAVFPKLQAALVEHAASYKLPKLETDWYIRVGGG